MTKKKFSLPGLERAAALLGLTCFAVSAPLGCLEADERPAPVVVGQASAPLLDVTIQSSVALLNAPGGVFCSGSLVSPLVVLTAAHCVFGEGAVDVPFAVYSGSDATIGGQYARVLTATPHPEYEPFRGSADLALLRVAPLSETLAPTPLTEDFAEIGSEVKFVGFGSSDQGPQAFRHVGTAEVTQVEEARFFYEPGTCSGDSGGPVLAETSDGDRLIGVVASGDLLCSRGNATSIVAHSSWIADTIRELDPEGCRGGDGRCGSNCSLGDPDCPCEEDERCVLCAGADPDCSFACGPDGTCADRCVAPDPDCHAGADGEECDDELDCASALCLEGQCRQRCGTDPRVGCAPWLECTEVGEGLSACLMEPRPAATPQCSMPEAGAASPSEVPWVLGLAAIGRVRRMFRAS